MTLLPLIPSFPVCFVILALIFWGLYFFQASDVAAESAVSVKGAEKDVKNKTQKTKEPPTSVPASQDHCQVKYLMPALLALQDTLPRTTSPSLLSIQWAAPFSPVPSTA